MFATSFLVLSQVVSLIEYNVAHPPAHIIKTPTAKTKTPTTFNRVATLPQSQNMRSKAAQAT